MKRLDWALAGLLVSAAALAACGARAGLGLDGPPPGELPMNDAGVDPTLDAAFAPDSPVADAHLDSSPDVRDSAPLCSYPSPTRSYPLSGCGDLGPRITGAEPTHLSRELPCEVQQGAFACGETPLSYADCEAYCLSDSFDLGLLTGSLRLSCDVWVYADDGHDLECDTVPNH
jgi:hypothetical protein